MFTLINVIFYQLLFVIILTRSYTSGVIFIKEPTKVLTAFPGQSITIECVIGGLTKEHVVKWIKGTEMKDNDIISRNHIITEDFNYLFTISQLQDNFSLTVKAAIDQEYMDFYLSVLDKNDVKVLFSLTKLLIAWTIPEPTCARLNTGLSMSEGETMRMMCQSSQSHERDVEYTWSKNGVIVTPGRFVFNLYTFVINRSDHGAKFTCNATKKSTGEMRSCDVDSLTVNYPPTVKVRHRSILAYECMVDARPSAVPIWVVDPEIPQGSYVVKDYATFFIIAPDYVSTGAILSCTASNSVGVGSDTLKITKNEPTTIVPSNENGSRQTVPHKNKSDVENTNFVMVIGVALGSIVVIVISGISIFGCCKKKRNQKSHVPMPQVSYGDDTENINDEVYQGNRLVTGIQRGKMDFPYEIIGTNEANLSPENGYPLVAVSARNNENSTSSPGYTNIVLNMDKTSEDGNKVTAKVDSNVTFPPVKSARNTIHAPTEEHLSTLLNVKPDSKITYASIVPRSKRASQENKTKSIHTDFCLSSEVIAKTSAGKSKQDPRLGYAKVIPKSKRNMNVVTDNKNQNEQGNGLLSVNKKQNTRFGYTNVIPASERKTEETKRASSDFFIDDNSSKTEKQKYDHNKKRKNSKTATKHGYTAVIPKSKRIINDNKECNTDNSTDYRISYADIDFSNVKKDGKPWKVSKDSRVSYANIDFSQASMRQKRKSQTPPIPKSGNVDGTNNSLNNQ